MSPGSISAPCPSCGRRVDLTSLETRGGREDPANKTAESEDLLGQILGGYELLRVIGRGGMGVVYEGRRRNDGVAGPEVVAVKVLADAFSDSTEFVARFVREASALTKLEHPNLARVFGQGVFERPERKPLYFFVMEKFDGEDLRSRMARGRLAVDDVARVVTGAARGLAYAHRAGIVHRDVKPANILVRGSGTDLEVKVVDFGVAHIAAGEYTLTTLTRSELILGTINYMAPEQRLDAGAIDHRADVYALGAVAYELLTGRLPMGAFPRPSELVRSLRPVVDREVVSALRPDPSDRPNDAEDFALRLSRALERRSNVPLFGGTAAVAAVGAAIFFASAKPTFNSKAQTKSDLEVQSASLLNVPATPQPTKPELETDGLVYGGRRLTTSSTAFAQAVPSPRPSIEELRPAKAVPPKAAQNVFTGDIDEVLGALDSFELKSSGNPNDAQVGQVKHDGSRPAREVALDGLADAIVGSAAATLRYARPAAKKPSAKKKSAKSKSADVLPFEPPVPKEEVAKEAAPKPSKAAPQAPSSTPTK